MICAKMKTYAHKNYLWGSVPSPPIRRVSSSIRSSGKGGRHNGFMAMDMSFIGLSSAAIRLDESFPHRRQRWMMAHSPFLRVHDASAVRFPVSRFDVHMQAGQAVRAVVAVICSCAC